MVDLERLMTIEGVLAAGEFGVGGSLIAYRGDLPEDRARDIAMICAANNLMGKMQVECFSRRSGMRWTPFRGWAASGGDYTVCIVGEIGVLVRTAFADFNEIYRILNEEATIP